VARTTITTNFCPPLVGHKSDETSNGDANVSVRRRSCFFACVSMIASFGFCTYFKTVLHYSAACPARPVHKHTEIMQFIIGTMHAEFIIGIMHARVYHWPHARPSLSLASCTPEFIIGPMHARVYHWPHARPSLSLAPCTPQTCSFGISS